MNVHEVATREAGFTLIEVLIALLVLVSGMVSVIALFTHSVGVHRGAVDDARSALVAEEVFDRMRVEWDGSGNSGSVTTLDYSDDAFRPFEVTTSVAPIDGSEDALAATVKLTWARGAKEQEETFVSILLRDGFAAKLAELKNPKTR